VTMRDVTDLKGYVLDFINAAKASPKMATDPDVLARLEDAAMKSFTGAFGAMSIPIAPETWEVRTVFLGGTAGGNFVSERVQLDVPFPVMVVGLYPSLSVLTTGGATVPTLNDIDCQLDLNLHEYMTDIQGNTTAQNAVPSATATPTRDGNFVTLAALGTANTQGGRLIGWVVPYRTAQIGITFRWKQGGGVYKDTIVSLAFDVRPLEPEDQ
jgi:hypothetical protein